MRLLKSILIGAVLGLLAGTTLIALSVLFNLVSSAVAEPAVYHDVGSRTVKMLNPDNLASGGTGFAVKAASGETFTLTNAHVCLLSRYPYMIANRNGRNIRLQIIDISDTSDLCLLQPFPQAEGLSLAKGIDFGDRVFVVGHPLLQPLTIRSGYLADRADIEINYCRAVWEFARFLGMFDDLTPDSCMRKADSYLATVEVLPGNSGSAATNQDGDVIGVVYATNGAGVGIIVPLSTVRRFLSVY